MNLKQAKESGNWFKREGWNLWLMADNSSELGVLNETGSEVGLTLDDVIATDWITTPTLDKSETSDNKEVLKSLRDTSIILQNQIMNVEDKIVAVNSGIELILSHLRTALEEIESLKKQSSSTSTVGQTATTWKPNTVFYSATSLPGSSTNLGS